MAEWFRRHPISVIIGWATTLLTVLLVLQGSHILTGPVARWVDLAAGILQVLLTAYAKQHVTPVANPRDNEGNKLVPVSAPERPW